MQGYFSAPESYSDFFGVFSKNIYRKAVWVTVDIQISKWVIWCWKMLLKCHFPQLHEKLFVHWAKLLFISSIQNVNNILTGQILTISAVSKRSVWKNVRGSLWNGRSFMVEKLINSSSYKLHTSQWRSNDAERGIREIADDRVTGHVRTFCLLWTMNSAFEKLNRFHSPEYYNEKIISEQILIILFRIRYHFTFLLVRISTQSYGR